MKRLHYQNDFKIRDYFYPNRGFAMSNRTSFHFFIHQSLEEFANSTNSL